MENLKYEVKKLNEQNAASKRFLIFLAKKNLIKMEEKLF